MAPFAPAAEIVSKLMSLSWPDSRPIFELYRRGDLVDLARHRDFVEPGKEPHHREPVPEMGGARPCDLGRVLDRLRQDARVLARYDLRAVRLQRLREPHRRRVRIEPDARLRFAERLE